MSKKNRFKSPRLVASQAVNRVGRHGDNLDKALDKAGIADLRDSREIAFARSLTYGALRWYHQIDAIIDVLLDKPLPGKHSDVRSVLVVALYQLAHTDIAPHGVVSESVESVAGLRKGWARGLVNAILRNYQRNRETLHASLENNPGAQLSHPRWLLESLQAAWPEDWPTIVRENNLQAPMSLRVNTMRQSRDEYLHALAAAGIQATPSPVSAAGVTLEHALHVESLPGFSSGQASVQDIAPQLAAGLLDAQPGMHVLDACAAPGGKTAHALEQAANDLQLTALELDPERARRIEENLHRLSLQANVIVDDAAHPDRWWDGALYDRILLDAPCSGTGVIRRNPDIKLLRRSSDIDASVALQQTLLEALWPLLKPGGLLLYATCSVLPVENSRLVADFMAGHDDAQERKINVEYGRICDAGIQIFPGTYNMDGFFYARLVKNS